MKEFLLVLLCCLSGEIVSSADVDWCKLDCSGKTNTMCKYGPIKKKSGECKDIEMYTTPTVRKDILHKHNEYRNRMANGEVVENGVTWPKGSDMRQMSWDYNLEKLALRWVQQCFASPAHDTCRRSPEFAYNGQNKGFASDSSDFPTPYGSFNGWIGEIKDAKPSIVDKLVDNSGGNTVLHFTQVIWAESYKLGCAAIHAIRKGLKTTIITCNYGPGGNIIDKKIYSKGDPCNPCPSGTSCSSNSTYPQLCASPTDSKMPEDIPDPPDGWNGSCKPRIFGMPPENSNILTSSLSFTLTSLTIKIAYYYFERCIQQQQTSCYQGGSKLNISAFRNFQESQEACTVCQVNF